MIRDPAIRETDIPQCMKPILYLSWSSVLPCLEVVGLVVDRVIFSGEDLDVSNHSMNFSFSDTKKTTNY